MVEDEAADAGESAVATMYNPFAALDTLRFCIITASDISVQDT